MHLRCEYACNPKPIERRTIERFGYRVIGMIFMKYHKLVNFNSSVRREPFIHS